MSNLQELYQQLIIDHGRSPRNFGALLGCNHQHEGFNPLCGDRITVFVNRDSDTIKEIKFTGSGCAISMASASLMSQFIRGKTEQDIRSLFQIFHNLVMGKQHDAPELGKLAALAGVAAYPMRVKCATLCWHTLFAALNNSNETVSTENA